MPIQKCKPTSPGRRFVEKVVHDHLHKGAPYAPLVEAKNVLVVVITTVTLLHVTLVVVTSSITVLLTLNVTKMAFLRL
jgi:hypothetical protein